MDFKNAWWLYEEIYIIDDKYEIHALMETAKGDKTNLGYFTIKVKNVIVE